MYKFFSFAFFTLTISAFSVLVIDSNLLFDRGLLWVFILLFLLIYVGFVVSVIFRAIFQVKKDFFVTRSFDFLGSKFSFVSKYFGLLQSLFALFIVVFVFMFGVLAGIRGFGYIVSEVLDKEILVLSDSLTHGSSMYDKVTQLNKEVSDMQRHMFEESAERFLENNQVTYKYSTPLAEYTLFNTKFQNEQSSGFNNRYFYKFSYCFKDSVYDDVFVECPTLVGINGSTSVDRVAIAQGEIIEDFSVRSFDLVDVERPVLLVNVETNIRTISFFVYPKHTTDSDHAYIIRATNSTLSLSNGTECSFEEKALDSITFECIQSSYYKGESDEPPVPETFELTIEVDDPDSEKSTLSDSINYPNRLP